MSALSYQYPQPARKITPSPVQQKTFLGPKSLTIKSGDYRLEVEFLEVMFFRGSVVAIYKASFCCFVLIASTEPPKPPFLFRLGLGLSSIIDIITSVAW